MAAFWLALQCALVPILADLRSSALMSRRRVGLENKVAIERHARDKLQRFSYPRPKWLWQFDQSIIEPMCEI
jgi:hypothetical protein